MSQFRFKGVSPQGKIIKGEFEAEDKKTAKKKVEKLSRQRTFQLHSLEEKKPFVYKVSKNGRKKKITGEQEAYNKEELEQALENLGYEVLSVQKKWFNFIGGVPTREVVSFIRLCADLLNQQLTFNEILQLLAEDISNRKMKETIREIERDLKEGKEGQEVYGKHEDVFGKFATYMLAIASTSGNMSQVFESTAKFLERDAEFKKNLRRSLLMPSITFIAIIATLVFYVGYIFPKTAEMFARFDITLPPMTAATLDVSYWIQGNWFFMTLAVVIPIIGLIITVRFPKGRLWFDKMLLKVPIIGDLLHKTSIEIFARVFYTLYSGSGENVDVIRVAAEACRNRYMEQQIKTISIPMMLKEGKGLVESLEAAKVFTKTAMGRFRLGAESGSLRENAKQLADYYELQTSYKMESVIDSINLSISMVIMIVLVFITIVSSETAVIQPNTPM